MVVVWNDAWASAAVDVTLKDVGETHQPAVMETRGWLLRDDEVGISLANERCLDQGDDAYRGHSFIPRGMVVEVHEVPSAPKRTRRRKPKAAT